MRTALLLAIMASLPAANAVAQDGQRKLDGIQGRASALDGGDARPTSFNHGSDLVVEAGDAESNATVSVSSFFAKGDKARHYRFGATAPFDRDKTDSVAVGTLSGLTAGTSVSAEFGWVEVSGLPEKESAIGAVCDSVMPQFVLGYAAEAIEAFGNWPCSLQSFGSDVVDQVTAAVRSINKERQACIDKPPQKQDEPARFVECHGADDRPGRLDYPEARAARAADIEVIAERARKRLADSIDAALGPVRLWTIGATGSRQRFSFVLPTAPTDVVKEDARGWGVTGAYTRMGRALLWSIGYSHEETHTPADKVSVCSPIAATGSLSCSNASLGAPEENEAEIVFGEVRWVGAEGRLAMSPRVELDVDEREWAVHLPVYFVQNKEGALTAGIAAGYTSKQSGMELAIFVGKEFAFFK